MLKAIAKRGTKELVQYSGARTGGCAGAVNKHRERKRERARVFSHKELTDTKTERERPLKTRQAHSAASNSRSLSLSLSLSLLITHARVENHACSGFGSHLHKLVVGRARGCDVQHFQHVSDQLGKLHLSAISLVRDSTHREA